MEEQREVQMGEQPEVDEPPKIALRRPRTLLERALETGYVVAFLFLQGMCWQQVALSRGESWEVVLGVPLGWILADLLSGTLHFLADNFGTPTTPLVGRAIISTFREHHVHPKKMLEHGFFERNGWNCAGASVLALPVLALPNSSQMVLSSTLLTASFFLSFTNQIHAWAHDARRPNWVRKLQRWGIILSPSKHAEHHRPFDAKPGHLVEVGPPLRPSRGHYCITSGICDRALSLISPS